MRKKPVVFYRYIGENLKDPLLKDEHFEVNGIEVTGRTKQKMDMFFEEAFREGEVETIILFQHPSKRPEFKDIVHFIHKSLPDDIREEIQKQEKTDAQKVHSGRF